MKKYKCGNCGKYFTFPYRGLCPRCGHNSYTTVPEILPIRNDSQLDLFESDYNKSLKYHVTT